MITIVITVGDLKPERRAPVVAALQENLANPLVDSIQVVTEVPEGEHVGWLLQVAGDEICRIHIVHVAARPTFAKLFGISNELLAADADTVAVMNADISIASNTDAARILNALDTLNARKEPVVLAITRHDVVSEIPELTLYESNGLPNMLSADCWVFQRPLYVERELFYAPGQMNCDMFLAHDLISTGHRLYNPCLDVVLKHHEPGKDESFYKEKLQEESVQNLLDRHVILNDINPFNYFSTLWAKTEWLRWGYRPKPLSTNGRRLILAVSQSSRTRLSQLWETLISLSESHRLEILIVYDGNLDELVTEYVVKFAANESCVGFVKPCCGLNELRRALLSGNQYSTDRLAFTTDFSRLDDALLEAAHSIFSPLLPTPPPPPPPIGCSLLTSLFSADSFIRCFLHNITALVGYGGIIEHILLVSTLSETELDALCHLMASHPNVLILWHRHDPGLYECWNIGIRVARTDYVSNANVDDLRDPHHVITLLRHMEMHPEVAVAATALVPFNDYPTNGTLPPPNEVWYVDQPGRFGFLDLALPIDPAASRLEPHNMPHCMPVWRRTLHERYGWFDEAQFGTYADWAFWLKVLADGSSGWLVPEPLGFYFINPTSHNRRGTDLDMRHRAVEEAFIGIFHARTAGRLPNPPKLRAGTPCKLSLEGQELYYGRHRNAFSNLILALEPLNCGESGCRLVPFLERQFVWGTARGEAASSDPQPLTKDWIGILHVPFDAPYWFEDLVRPETFFATPLFQESLPACRGILTLCSDLERDLKTHLPGIPTLALRHPTDLNVRMFNPDSYFASPCVVQVGDWLRKLHAIHLLRAPGHHRIMLLKQHTLAFMEREMAVFGDHRDAAVEMRHLIPDDEYDTLLASAVVLCLMYATAANNLVIECIARATPIIINPLPAAVEYLGEDYPLYARDVIEADALLKIPEKIKATHQYLLRRRTEIDLTYEGFCYRIAESALYADL